METEKYMLERLDKSIIIADWQYDATIPPVETAVTLKNAGFDVLLCPWDEDIKVIDACLDTVKSENLYGFIHTTWHTLSSGIQTLATTASSAWGEQNSFSPSLFAQFASIVRKLCPANGDYAYAGWAEKQIADYY
jgi:hypothetical protein